MLLFVMSFLLSACTNENIDSDMNEIEGQDESEKLEDEIYNIDEVIKECKPNELGDIPVIMYHAVLLDAPTVYQRSVEGFKKDLEYMYSNGYVTISNRDYVDFNIDIPKGKTPILLTFDDGEAGTFDLVRSNDGTLMPKENTAIYLMEEFYKEHPDFGKNAILFINGHSGTFVSNTSDKSITLEEKIEWLFNNGYEVSNHTLGHLNIKNSNATKVQKQIAYVDKLIKDINPNAILDTIAYPFGAKPKAENEWVITNGSYDGHNYSYQIGFREGPSKARFVPTISKDFEALNTPRLRGNEGDVGDMWSYFSTYEKSPTLRFISDGNPNIITVPQDKASKIDYAKAKDKEIVVYDKETLTKIVE